MIAPDDPRHGQERGYFAHRKAGQQPCDACVNGHRIAQTRRTLNAMHGQPAWVPALGSQRRLQALQRLGWPMSRIADEAGRSREQLRDIMRRQHVTRAVADMVADVYDRLSMTLPDCARACATCARAEAAGWLPPLAWTDIDDPHEAPRKITRAPGRPEVLTTILEDFDFLVAAGESEHLAAKRVGVELATIRDYRLRAARRHTTDEQTGAA